MASIVSATQCMQDERYPGLTRKIIEKYIISSIRLNFLISLEAGKSEMQENHDLMPINKTRYPYISNEEFHHSLPVIQRLCLYCPEFSLFSNINKKDGKYITKPSSPCNKLDILKDYVEGTYNSPCDKLENALKDYIEGKSNTTKNVASQALNVLDKMYTLESGRKPTSETKKYTRKKAVEAVEKLKKEHTANQKK